MVVTDYGGCSHVGGGGGYEQWQWQWWKSIFFPNLRPANFIAPSTTAEKKKFESLFSHSLLENQVVPCPADLTLTHPLTLPIFVYRRPKNTLLFGDE